MTAVAHSRVAEFIRSVVGPEVPFQVRDDKFLRSIVDLLKKPHMVATRASDKKAEAESKIKPRTQRKTAPKDAPMLMANIEFNISKHISQWLMKFHN